MKKNNIYLLLIIVYAIGILSCKRDYGYKFPDGYENGEKDANTFGSKDSTVNDYSKIEQAKVFPGLVGSTEPRLQNYNVNIDLRYNDPKAADIKVAAGLPQPWFSTGLYAPAGEPIKVVVPAGMNGLVAQIGGWTTNLTGITPALRDAVVFNQKPLAPGTNIIRNVYGGPIYITTNFTLKAKGIVGLNFSGAVKSPDFILGESTDQSWNQMIQQSTVPWLQLRGKHIIFEVPKYFIEKHPIPNPTALMQEWENIITKDFYEWKGLSYTTTDSLKMAPILPVRVIMDKQPVNAYVGNGAPIVVQYDENLFANTIADLNYIRANGSWRILSEMGRNYVNPYWRWSPMNDGLPNLFTFKTASRLGTNMGNLFDGRFTKVTADAITYANPVGMFGAPETSTFATDMAKVTNNELMRIFPLVQLFDYYNKYEIYGYFDSISRYTTDKPILSDQEKIDFIYTNASKYLKIDLLPFFLKWGLPVSTAAADVLRSTYAYPMLNKEVYLYNPVTKTGGQSTILWNALDVRPRNTWTISACCQNINNPVSAAFDNMTSTFWASADVPNPVHITHSLTITMNSMSNLKSFWYVTGSNFFPSQVSINVKSAPTDSYTTYTFNTSANTQPFTRYDINFQTVQQNIRYIQFDISSVVGNPAYNKSNIAEFGVTKP